MVSRLTFIPLPCDSGSSQYHHSHPFVLWPVPIRIVTHPSQLPQDFLFPTPQRRLVIGFDCEGVNLSRNGALCIMQLAFPDGIYLVDAFVGGETLMRACKPALESSHITKVIHDCKRDSEALYFQFGIKLQNVMDTQIAYALIEEQQGHPRAPNDYISFVSLLADPRYCGVAYSEKQKIRDLLQEDPEFWMRRPWSELMVRTASDDVRFLPYIYDKMMQSLNQESTWKLNVRGALHCRCFCVTNNGYADWPPAASLPENLTGEEDRPEEEVLSVVDVPPGRMGRVIGRKGVCIMSIKESCHAEILIGGQRGPHNKVFVIGPVRQVRKAEAILRGRALCYS